MPSINRFSKAKTAEPHAEAAVTNEQASAVA
jgi:hypothetical protein